MESIEQEGKKVNRRRGKGTGGENREQEKKIREQEKKIREQ